MPRLRNSNIYLTLICYLGIITVSCSVEKNTSATRNFHNLTSNYNIFFNATESFKDGYNMAVESHMDDFTTILPLFYYEDESVQQSITPQMKRAIDKCTKIITFHSITAKPKVKKGRQTEKDKEFYNKNEYNKWIDDCYLLVGKSYMYQGEYFKAAESFRHVINNYPGEDAYFSALCWLVRAYNVIGEFDESEKILVGISDIEEYPKKNKEELYTTYADFYIKKEAYEDATLYLKLALDQHPKKNRKIRYTFILAQLYKEAGNSEASINSYKQVIRMNPPYIIAFNSKVNMAEAFEAGSANSGEIKKLLFKMLRDSKNKEFKDQIYFALGNILMEEGDRDKAIEYYHLSVSSSIQNNYQKGESCLTLAKIYYNEPMYTLSAAYYDTAVNLLNEDYPNYAALSLRSNSLNELVYNINMFELQDSVQVLAKMSDSERFEVIDQIIDNVRKEEEAERTRQQEAMQDLQYNRSGMLDNSEGIGNQKSGGKWYFYNLNAKSFGKPEFRMKWGDRKLEDNWRRSNKQSISELLVEEGGNANGAGESGTIEIIDNKSREYYLKDIPLSDSAMEVSNTLLEEALYNMGMIYRNDLLDYDKAISALEELINRYPDGNYTMPAYYYLYDLYNNIQQPAKATIYKELLNQKYPDSHMAKLLTNPNYIKELEEQQNQVEKFYESVYANYKAENYKEVVRLANQGLNKYTEQESMLERLAYLRAVSLGALKGKEVLKVELDSILARYPGTEIADEAQSMIDYMFVAFPVIKEAEQVKEAVQLYTFDPQAKLKFMLAVNKSENLNLVNFNLLNYNLDNFNNYDLKIELQKLNVDYNLLVVDQFSTNEGVERYANRVKNDILEIMGDIPADSYEVVLISDENYKKLLNSKEIKPYLLFYKQYYKQ